MDPCHAQTLGFSESGQVSTVLHTIHRHGGLQHDALHALQVTEAQNAAGNDSAPGTAQQQQQQADALSAAALQPDKAAAILSDAAKPLEAPEPDQYTVSLCLVTCLTGKLL